MTGAPRVLHCPTDVGGSPQSLARAERAIGLRSWCVVLDQTYFGFRSDEVLLAPGASPARRELARWRLLARALRDFDLVHLNFGQTILPVPMPAGSGGPLPGRLVGLARRAYAGVVGMRDLDLLRLAGRGVVVTFQGDDARQGDVCRATQEISIAGEVDEDYYTADGDAAKRRIVRRFARKADRIYFLNPDLAAVLPPTARFLPYPSLDPREWTPCPPPERLDRPVVVLHAPTRRDVKGTRHVLAAVEALREEGLEIELVLVEGMTHDQARRQYERADILVDQLLAGWYGGLAVELMALAKPVVTYLRHADLGCLPPGMRDQLPVVEATPDSIREVLRELLTTRRGELRALGLTGRRFVERWHDPRRIAADLRVDYERVTAERQRGWPGRRRGGAR